MIRIAKMTDYAVIILATMAEDPAHLFQAKELSEKTSLNLPTTAKLLKDLARKGLLLSIRGALGGYRLKFLPKEIKLIQIIEAMEGRLAITECNLGHEYCSNETQCTIRTPWLHINEVLIKALSSIKLEDLISTKLKSEISDLDTFYVKNIQVSSSNAFIK